VDLLRAIENEQMRDDIPQFSVGDRVRVNIKVVEGEKERIQAFEGTVIARKHGGMNETFTVRRVSYGEGVERVFPLNSSNIDSIELITKGTVRRGKLYYLRGRSGKASRIRESR
jgi:large subunit ribosomal protein L19